MKAKYLIAGALAALMLSGAAQAHRQWMLPSSTTLSGTDSWVTVDAAVSNDLFYFEHFPMRTDGIAVTEPDGTTGKIENAATGKSTKRSYDLLIGADGINSPTRTLLENAGLPRNPQQGGRQLLPPHYKGRFVLPYNRGK